jgi:type I site-specific restriction endonuclease
MENVMIVDTAQKYNQLIAQIDANNTLLLERAVAFEKMRIKNVTLSRFVVAYLDSFEGMFDTDESQFSAEHMIDYLNAAKWMEANYSRVNNRIKHVQEKLTALPWK